MSLIRCKQWTQICVRKGNAMYTHKCRQCGITIETKSKNTMYCCDCARMRKKAADMDAWRKRRQKKLAARAPEEAREHAMRRLEPKHAKELGISPVYYVLWKEANPIQYKKWMEAHLPAVISAQNTNAVL